MFVHAGVLVHYSVVDNDDTLAAYAQHHGACVLSRDKDFLRYNGATYIIFKDWEVSCMTGVELLKLTRRDD